jgi:putative transposase
MEWTHILAYITGTVDQELLLRNEYLAAENRILMAKLNGRPRFSDVERATLGEIGFGLGRRALSEVATVARLTPSLYEDFEVKRTNAPPGIFL